MKILSILFFPNALPLIAALFLINSRYLAKITDFQVDLTASILLILCALLAWRFDRSRVVYALQLLLFTDIGITYYHASPTSPTSTINILILAVLLVNLLFMGITRERGIHSRRGLLTVSFPAIQAAGIFFWLRLHPEPSIPYFETSYLTLPLPIASHIDSIPETILLISIVALIVQSIRFLRYPNPLEAAMFWLVVSVAATLFFTADLPSTLLRASAVLALLISFIEIAYTLAYRDELTGVPGRRAMMELFKKLGGRYCIAMVDIDFFKKFNDKYGHDIGDQVLQMVAVRLSKCTGGGKAFRYGGEEFCIVFPGKSTNQCMEHLEAVRKAVGEEPFTIRKIGRPINKPKSPKHSGNNNSTVNVTISIGVAEKGTEYNNPELVMKQADKALYRAKEAGRNKVCK